MKRSLVICLFNWVFLSAFCQTAIMTSDVNSGCIPLVVQFDGTASSGTGTITYYWDFGNGNTAIGVGQSNPGAVYTTPGTYTATLQIEDDNGFSNFDSLEITVFSSPVADFVLSGPSEGCSPLTTSFSDLSVPGDAALDTWIWDFGDGNSSGLQNPNHVYSTEGVYNVALIVRDVNNCQGDTTFNTLIRVGYVQDVDFTTALPDSNTLSCNDSLTVNFSDQTAYFGPGPFSYLWDFGDGNTDTNQNPSHTFTNFGNYDVSLTITEGFANCATTEVKTSYVNLLDVIPDFTFTPATGCQSQLVSFTNTSNTFLGNQVVTWDFGDGNMLTGGATDPGMINPSNTYGPGVYTPSISIDVNGGECIRTYTSPPDIIVKDFPTVDFSGDTLSACQVPFDVQFSTIAPEAVAWNWDFGDGNTSTQENPLHTYTTTGSFDVTLTVTDSLGCQSTETKTNYVNIDPPVANFTSDIFTNASFPATWDGRDVNLIAGGCIPLDITFTDLSTSLMPIVDWDWDFGDGNTLGGVQNPTHTYTTVGTFPVELTVTTIDGCTDTFVCDSCAVTGDSPEALIDTTNLPLQQCCEAEFDFINITAAGTADYFWYEVSTGAFEGTDTTVNNWYYFEQLPVDPNPQTLDFTFYAWSNGCLDTLFYPAFTTLHQPYLEPNMVVDPCIYSDSLHILAPTALGLMDSISWNFTYNNQNVYNTTTPSFLSPDTAGTHDLTVTAWDLTNIYNLSNGDTVCSCTYNESAYFPGIPIAYDFTSAVDSGCVPLTVQFTGPSQNVATWAWDFGNGQTSTAQNPSTIYDTIGQYNVVLIVTDNGGCSDTITKSQFIDAIGANVSISSSAITGCIPFDIDLADISNVTAPIVSRTWVFGNGDTLVGNDSTTSYIYDTVLTAPAIQGDGINISLITQDSDGCINIGTITVYPGDPVAEFDSASYILCSEDSLVFTAIEEDSLGILPFTFDWELDNPAPATGSGNPIAKNYPDGSYVVRLIVTDSVGCTDTSSYMNFTVSADQPQAGFVTDGSAGTCPPLLVNFADTSIIGRSPITDWFWDFGDAANSVLQHPANIYSTENSFDVSLRVTDSLGCTDSILLPGFITLTGVVGDFQVFNNVVCENESATFIANSPSATTFIWDFGDGNIGFGDTIVHTYTFAATRYPSLIMEDSSGLCSNTFTDTVTVLPLPDNDLGPDQEICEDTTVRLGIELEVDETALWNTGETTDSISIDTSGNYLLVVTNTTTGCSREDRAYVQVNPLPIVQTPATKFVCINDLTDLTVTSSDSIVSYDWFESGSFFDSGDTIEGVPITAPRTFIVIGTDINSCTNRDTLFIDTVPPPILSIPDTSICPDENALISAVPQSGSVANETYEWYEDGNLLSDTTSTLLVDSVHNYEVIYRVGECYVNELFEVSFDPLPSLTENEVSVFCSETDTGTAISPGNYASYNWFLNGSSNSSLFVTFQDYYYVEVGNEFGCTSVDSIEVIDLCPPRVFIGNAFSPNGDGGNDIFLAKGDYIAGFEMTIFNRWGEIIYYSTDINEGWDGRYLGNDMPEGVYPWLIKYTGEHPDYTDPVNQEGKVTLIR